MPCMVRVERRGKSPPVPQVTGGSCKLYPKQHRKENSAPWRRAGPVRFREVARGVWQQASQIDGCIDRTRLIGLLEKRRHPLWRPFFRACRQSGKSHFAELLQGAACTPLAHTCPLIGAKSCAQVAAFCGLIGVGRKSLLHNRVFRQTVYSSMKKGFHHSPWMP